MAISSDTGPSLPARILAFAMAVVLAIGSAGCGAPREEIVLEFGAKVRFLAPGYSRSWQLGEVGEVGEMGGESPCTAVMVPDSWDHPRRFDVIPVDSIRRLQLSTSEERQAYAAAGMARGEAWKEVAIRAVHARYGGCNTRE